MAYVTTGMRADAVAEVINNKVDKREGMGLSSNDFTNADRNKLENIDLNQYQEKLTFDDAPTANSDNPVKSSGIKAALDAKVSVAEGKCLSTNDYTNADKTTLMRIMMYDRDIEPSDNDNFSIAYQWNGRQPGYSIRKRTDGLSVEDNLIIPYEYDDGEHGLHPVTAIIPHGFTDINNIKSIIIPKSVTIFLKDMANTSQPFHDCPNLEYIEIPDNIVINDNITYNSPKAIVHCNRGSEAQIGCASQGVKYICPKIIETSANKTKTISNDPSDDKYPTEKAVYDAMLNSGVSAVSSVNGKIGNVTLVKGDVGLGNVDNTSDLNKPISIAAQTALDAKQDTIVRRMRLYTKTSAAAVNDIDSSLLETGDVIKIKEDNPNTEKTITIGNIKVRDGDYIIWIGNAWEHITNFVLLNNRIDGVFDGLRDLAGDIVDIEVALNGKQNKASTVAQSSPSAITLADNTEYFLTGVSDLALTYPNSEHWECVIVLTTASSGDVTISFPQETAYIGDVPNFSNSETWEISIRDGIVVTGKAVSV